MANDTAHPRRAARPLPAPIGERVPWRVADRQVLAAARHGRPRLVGGAR